MGYAIAPLGAITGRRYGRRDRLGDTGTTSATPTQTSSTQQSLQNAQQAAALARSAGSLLTSIENIFDPGKARDAQRLQRAQFFTQSADVGSITAALYIRGGLLNVGSNEMPDYTAAAASVQATAPDVWAAAMAQQPKWLPGDPNTGDWDRMFADVKKDLTSISQYVAAPSTGTTTTPVVSHPTTSTPGVTIAGMTTTAPFNYLPLLLAGALAVVPALVRKH